MKRTIVGLKWARELDGKPSYIPIGRSRGAKAFGVRYERELAKALPKGWLRGVWFEFEDLHGPGCCQVDFLYSDTFGATVLELKYTWNLAGQQELNQLYLPIVRRALGLQTNGIVVTKNLTPEARNSKICESLADANNTSGLAPVVWHWIGGAINKPSCRSSSLLTKPSLAYTIGLD